VENNIAMASEYSRVFQSHSNRSLNIIVIQNLISLRRQLGTCMPRNASLLTSRKGHRFFFRTRVLNFAMLFNHMCRKYSVFCVVSEQRAQAPPSDDRPILLISSVHTYLCFSRQETIVRPQFFALFMEELF
jgi:hypothetical protein